MKSAKIGLIIWCSAERDDVADRERPAGGEAPRGGFGA
jgi:hypothetical protein